MIPLLIFFYISTILSLSLGYYLGRKNDNEEKIYTPQEIISKGIYLTKNGIKKITTPQIPTGRIKPKTALDMEKINQQPQKKEEMEEMKKTLDNIPELVKAKEQIQKLKENDN